MEKSSYETLYYKLSGVILPELGSTLAMRISTRRLDQYVAKRLKTVKTVLTGSAKGKQKRRPILDAAGNPQHIKRSTVNREITAIITIFNWATKRGYIKHNPVAGYEKPKRDDEIIKPPTLAETRAILAHAAEHLKRAISLSYYTGLRPGAVELLSPTWSDIDFENATINITSAKKGGLRSRSVPLKK